MDDLIKRTLYFRSTFTFLTYVYVFEFEEGLNGCGRTDKMTTEVDKTKRIGRWYFGGVASAMAACCTHPLDLLKVSVDHLANGSQLL